MYDNFDKHKDLIHDLKEQFLIIKKMQKFILES